MSWMSSWYGTITPWMPGFNVHLSEDGTPCHLFSILSNDRWSHTYQRDTKLLGLTVVELMFLSIKITATHNRETARLRIATERFHIT